MAVSPQPTPGQHPRVGSRLRHFLSGFQENQGSPLSSPKLYCNDFEENIRKHWHSFLSEPSGSGQVRTCGARCVGCEDVGGPLTLRLGSLPGCGITGRAAVRMKWSGKVRTWAPGARHTNGGGGGGRGCCCHSPQPLVWFCHSCGVGLPCAVYPCFSVSFILRSCCRVTYK